MKSSFFLILFYIVTSNFLLADQLDIKANNIKIDKKTNITIFENNVEIVDQFKNIINADYVEFDKKNNFLKLKGNIYSKDFKGNIFKSNKATYDNNNEIFQSSGETLIETLEGYIIETKNITIDNKNSLITTNDKSLIKDKENNKIILNNLEYSKENGIFKSVGKIKIIDKLDNTYNFSQIYIDAKNKEITGSDAKLYINQDELKLNQNNKPRIFSNTINIKDNEAKFIKSSFTMCDYRKDDKCPPWELKASKMLHNKIKKTIYYDNAVIKVYDIPIFYFPKLSHPDPSVERRSGFLVPSYSDTKNLGSSINVPYFWAIDADKDLTLKNRLFVSENPLLHAEYRQVFKDSFLTMDVGFTEGYKKTTSTKKGGEKSHFFTNFTKSYSDKDNISKDFEINLQHVSNKKYLKLYKIESNLIDYETSVLENFVNYSSVDDNDNSLFSLNLSNYRTLADTYNDKYEYILPEMTFDKQLFSSNYGYGNFNSNFKIHNYDTNKYKKFFTNKLEWNIDNPFSENIIDGKFLSTFRNINYEVNNVNEFKSETTSELFGAIGYLASLDLFKKDNSSSTHLLTPKALLKYAPNFMRKDKSDEKLVGKDLFTLDRVNSNENFEGGANITLGLDYEIDSYSSKTSFSIGQVINEKKNNKNMSDTSSLDKRFSDIVGSLDYKRDNNLSLKYNFSLDQNYKETNLNDITLNYATNNFNFNFNYLEEEKKLNENEYIKTSLEYKKGENGVFTFANKRNLITNSSEFYDLSYEYLNDCLRAGLFYRREFYNDSEIEAENSLMFKITISSFGSINSPSVSN